MEGKQMGYNISKEMFLAGARLEWSRLKRSVLAFCIGTGLGEIHFFIATKIAEHTILDILVMLVIGLAGLISFGYAFVSLLRAIFSLIMMFERRYG